MFDSVTGVPLDPTVAALYFDGGPHPNIHALFSHFAAVYFGNELGPTSVQWSSSRMTRCAGTCTLESGGGIVVRLSAPLLRLRPPDELFRTLLHEMIHAWIFCRGLHGVDGDHGPRFRAKVAQINAASGLSDLDPLCAPGGYRVDITHSMIAEVQSFQTHVWQCTSCGDVIRRATNRAPQLADCVVRSSGLAAATACRGAGGACRHHVHALTCGGNYVKIEEPERVVATRPRDAHGRTARLRGQPSLVQAWARAGTGRRLGGSEEAIVLSSDSE